MQYCRSGQGFHGLIVVLSMSAHVMYEDGPHAQDLLDLQATRPAGLLAARRRHSGRLPVAATAGMRICVP